MLEQTGSYSLFPAWKPAVWFGQNDLRWSGGSLPHTLWDALRRRSTGSPWSQHSSRRKWEGRDHPDYTERPGCKYRLFKVHAGAGPLLSLPTKLGVLPWLLPSPNPSPALEGSLPLWDMQNRNKVLPGLKMEVTSQIEPLLYLCCPFHVHQTCFNPNI